MKGKAILRSLLLAYGVTGLFLLILAFLLFQFEFGRRFYGGKDHTERPIYMGDRYRAFLLCSAASGIFSGTGEMGYDLCPCVDYFFHVSWWRSHWWDAVVKAYKKML